MLSARETSLQINSSSTANSAVAGQVKAHSSSSAAPSITESVTEDQFVDAAETQQSIDSDAEANDNFHNDDEHDEEDEEDEYIEGERKAYIERIRYSDRYKDSEYEYRHVIMPPDYYSKYVARVFAGCLLSEAEWRSIGIQQSPGWIHYELHAPEPHIFLFRRKLQ